MKEKKRNQIQLFRNYSCFHERVPEYSAPTKCHEFQVHRIIGVKKLMAMHAVLAKIHYTLAVTSDPCWFTTSITLDYSAQLLVKT